MISKQKRLLWIPGTFLIAVALAGFAPINAFNASLNDQLSRMDAILENNQWLNEKGQINVKSEIANASDDAYQVSSIMRYVIENYGAAPLQPYFKEDLVEIAQYQSVWSLVDTVLKFAELPNSNGYQNLSRHFYSDQAMKNGLVVSEFDYFLPNFNPINLHITQDNTKAFTIDEDEYQIRWNEANKNVELIQNGERLVGVSLVPTIDQLLIRPIAEDYMPMDLAIISNTENNYQIQLNLTNLEINTTTSELQYLGADVWIGLP